MKLRLFILPLAVVSLFLIPVWAQEESAMVIQLGRDGSAHISIESRGFSNLEGLKNIINGPSVANIYRDRLSSVFGPVANLSLSLRGETMIIEFDAPLAVERNGSWEVEERDFQGGVKRMSSLRVRPPPGAALVLLEPAAEEASGEWVWKDVDAIPHIVYRQRPQWPLALGAVLLLAVLGVLAWRRRVKGSP